MKSRELHTTPVLIVTNYQAIQEQSGKFLHTFTPENTPTIYKFIANQEAVLEEGSRYNIGYEVKNGENWVDISAIAKADAVEPKISHYIARQFGEHSRFIETAKSDKRVVHNATDGHYLGRKYAWRIYGMALSRDTFDSYLAYAKHPTVICYTDSSVSIAYKDEGIGELMEKFIGSLIKVGKTGNRFKTLLYPDKRWFHVKGISSITDKK